MVGNVYELDQIYFDYKKWDLLPSSTKQLDNLVGVLKRNQKMEIQVQGNTDSIASNEYNQILSAKRAQAVVNYLLVNGIGANRLSAVGNGEDNPVEDNGTETGRQKNRRVEFVIVKE
jgi:outer membrane protein OmpA-like peptidoglycan-associated protein